MRRVFSFFFALIKLALVAAAAFWIYLHPGKIEIEWLGQRTTTYVWFVALVLPIILFTFGLLYHGWRTILGWPRLWRKQRQVKALELGYKALNKGLLAVAGNDASTAAKQSKKAQAFLPDMALTHLLAAQAAQLSGDDIAVDTHLAKLAQHPDGQIFGLKGQLTRALQRQDQTEALRLSRLAYREQPNQPWIIDASVQLEARQRNWTQVEKILRQAVARETDEQKRWKKDLSAALLALSDEAAAKGDIEAALECAREALKKTPGWSPAAIRVAALWQRKGYRRRAQKVLQNAWEVAPHPDLVAAWAETSVGERTQDAASNIEKLISSNSDNAESALAMASVYRHAGLWGVARKQALRALDYRADRRAYKLLADIEQADSNDVAKTRAWLEKASDAENEPHWIDTLTQTIYPAWQPLNGDGNFNTIQWNADNVVAFPASIQKNLITA